MDNKKALIVLIVALVVITAGTIMFLTMGKVNQEDTHTIIFATDNGTVITTQMVGEGSKAIMPEPPTKDGYIFVGWTYNGETYDFNSNVTSNIKLEAKWHKIQEDVQTFIVSFNSEGGTTIENQIVEKSSKAIKPAEPVKEGYSFKGWMLNENEYDFNKVVTEDICLKASWEKNKEDNNIQVNNSTSNKNQEQTNSTNVVKVKTPKITEGGRGGDATGTIGLLLKLNSTEGITGIEIYSATSKDGKYTLQKTVKKQDWNNETATVYAQKGQHLYYKVRTYVKNTAGTFYSNYSNIMELDNSLKSPTLSTPAGGPGMVQFNVAYAGAYANGTELIDGWELYEKNGSKYTKVFTSETKFSTDVTLDVGESKTYVARVYAYNKSKERVYSAYSNEVKFEHTVLKPTLSTPAGGPGMVQFNVAYAGNYANGTDLIDGWELYEKNGSKYTKVFTSETKFSTDVTLDVGESKTYVARVYAYNKSKVKVYSAYSNEVTISNTN